PSDVLALEAQGHIADQRVESGHGPQGWTAKVGEQGGQAALVRPPNPLPSRPEADAGLVSNRLVGLTVLSQVRHFLALVNSSHTCGRHRTPPVTAQLYWKKCVAHSRNCQVPEARLSAMSLGGMSLCKTTEVQHPMLLMR